MTFRRNYMNKNFTTKMMVEGAVMLALAYALSLIPVFKMPFGGSITAGSMIPIIIFAIRWGLKPGLLVGFTFGLLKLTQDPYIIHPVQLALDYLLPFMLLGLAGIFKNPIEERLNTASAQVMAVVAVFVAFTARYICHVLSGVVFFSEYAGEQNAVIYSLIYNSTYLLPDMILAMVLMALIVKPVMKLAK